MLRLILILTIFFNTVIAYGQKKYWINFKDKDIENYDYKINLSPETIKNRLCFGLPLHQYTDIPLKADYLFALESTGIKISAKSKWFNAASAILTDSEKSLVEKLPFVKSLDPIDRNIILTGNLVNMDPKQYHIAMAQMQSKVFLENGLTGKGVSLGVIDAGFHGADKDSFLSHLFEEKRIIQQRDFLNPERKDIIVESATTSDGHGKRALEMICGYDNDEKTQLGMAVNAKYYLARTENGDKEYRGEEDKWIEAMEWMDSLGVRLISTSLGYAIKMDDPKDNYTQEQMDGKTARISKAAQIAYDQKGIFMVVSAGNEGDNASWRIVSAPADAEGVLSVGATRDGILDKIYYSSIGPEFLPYLKPNVSCFSPDGTSFSAPAVAGFVACLMEKAPQLSNKELKKIIEKSCHLYPYGNNYIGYGVPLAHRALDLIKNPSFDPKTTMEKEVKGKKIKLKMDKSINYNAVAFHKKNETIVIKQETVNIKKGKLKLKNKVGAVRTTFAIGMNVVEVFWK